MLVPASFNEKNPISEDLKAFYEDHSILREPWDGPAALLFSDGRYAGGMLDRNGLRPARYLITQGGMMVVASEVGVMDFEPGDIKEKGRLQQMCIRDSLQFENIHHALEGELVEVKTVAHVIVRRHGFGVVVYQGLRWLTAYSRSRGEKTMAQRLAAEILDAANNTGHAVKKREDTHKMAEANKALAHFRY